MEAWSAECLLDFNATKTESLTFSGKRETEIPLKLMNNTELTSITKHKHLGITVQRTRHWLEYIAEVTSKAKKKVDVIRNYMYKLDRRSLEKLYLSYIRPGLEYRCTIWDNCTLQEKEGLEKVQRAALRIITGPKREQAMASTMKIQGLKDYSKEEITKNLYKCTRSLIINVQKH